MNELHIKELMWTNFLQAIDETNEIQFYNLCKLYQKDDTSRPVGMGHNSQLFFNMLSAVQSETVLSRSSVKAFL